MKKSKTSSTAPRKRTATSKTAQEYEAVIAKMQSQITELQTLVASDAGAARSMGDLPLPPEVNLYLCHTLALHQAMRHLHDHWYSLNCLIPKDAEDEVVSRQMYKAFSDIEHFLMELTSRAVMIPTMTDDNYKTAMRRHVKHCEYVSPAELTTIINMGRKHIQR